MVYVRRLAKDNNRMVLQEICEDLQSRQADKLLVGLPPHELLDECLQIILTQPKLQALSERYGGHRGQIDLCD